MASHEIRVRTWVRGSDTDIRDGLLGFLSIEYGSLLIDNITLRRAAADGHLLLSFPRRTAKNGEQHAIVRPLDDKARREIEATILGQLGQREGVTS